MSSGEARNDHPWARPDSREEERQTARPPWEAGRPGWAARAGEQAGPPKRAVRTGRRTRRVLAWVLTGTLALAALLAGLAVLVPRLLSRPGPGVLASSGPASAERSQEPGAVTYIDDVRLGTCVNEVSDSTTSDKNSGILPLVSCSAPHDGEVLARFLLPPGIWPGEAKVRETAARGCRGRLEPLFENSPAGDRLATLAFVPLREEWPEDRLVVCVAVHQGVAPLVGPVVPGGSGPHDADPPRTQTAPAPVVAGAGAGWVSR
ncbi:hypothetical protein [Streptosporangium sp. NPDC049376]|uniref:hypothetical protein n=1 Tax=Streptosporangium sp. NPDC049376 TaxID=3366192 RepID=UPI0037942598